MTTDEFLRSHEEFEIGGRCDWEYACDICGDNEYWFDEDDEFHMMSIFRIGKIDYCQYCLIQKFFKKETKSNE